MLGIVFFRTFAFLYWSVTAVGVGWLTWVCFAHMPWVMAMLVFPLVLCVAAIALGEVVAAAAAIAAGILTGGVALIRVGQRWHRKRAPPQPRPLTTRRRPAGGPRAISRRPTGTSRRAPP